MAESNQSRSAIMELANMISVPMSLTAVIRLKVPDAIWQNGSNTPLSPAQILKRIQPPPTADPLTLQRFLRVLTSYGVFDEHVIENENENDVVERKYSLTEIGKCLVPDSDGLSYADYILQHHQEEILKAWTFVHELVLDPKTEPFVKANGEAAYLYYGKKPEMNELMLKAMSGVSEPFMKALLDGYDGFKGVHTLVDIGGSSGDSLKMIMKKFPNIKHGINFDLPDVVAKAPAITDVTHVGGDMFKAIPAGDAMFIKWVMATYNDDDCKLIMENSYKALPAGGKLIACDPVVPKHSDDSHRTRALLNGDIFLTICYRGKNRTEEEYRKLGLSVGFSQMKAFYIDHFFTTLEFHK